MAAAIARLDADDRELVELKVFGGLTLREIAEVTGHPPGTVATRYRRAIDFAPRLDDKTVWVLRWMMNRWIPLTSNSPRCRDEAPRELREGAGRRAA